MWQSLEVTWEVYGAGAASVRVSNELGAGRPAAARLAAQTVAVLALTLMVCIAMLLASLHRLLPLIITSDKAVIDGTQRVIPTVAYMLIGDGVNAVLSGVVRGCGRQAKGALTRLLLLCWPHAALDSDNRILKQLSWRAIQSCSCTQ